VSEQEKAYVKYREKVESFASFWFLVTVILLALSKSPDFTLKDLFGLVSGEIHNGYIAAYGSLAVALIIIRLHLLLRESLIYRELLNQDLKGRSPAGPPDFPRTSAQLLRPPFWLTSARGELPISKWSRWSRRVAAVMPLCLLTVACGLFTYFYFGFARASSPETKYHDLLLGPGHWKGFPATWTLMGIRKEVFLNAPYHTWVAIALLVYALWVTIAFCRYVFGSESPYRGV